MSTSMTLPICSCCHRHIMPNDKCVKFNCPECGSVLIWRCESCREAARPFTCRSCSFSGP
ncbi:zinc finger domain-containing protein [Candidatus Nitrosotenuis uzonensis]|uniref:zinc finger domain-containing protein n=1 Tax=Candidatus Nitrosotenuis uzonensis TaxID=1407055 RepID=UPI0009DFFC92|nr:zinc finger domain-containing protein [Candidatus Nitrosotenuis uzonensis]